jgi:hypothetical protein
VVEEGGESKDSVVLDDHKGVISNLLIDELHQFVYRLVV